MVDSHAEVSHFTKPYISPKHYKTYRFYRFYRFTAYGFMAGRALVQPFVRLFQWVPGRGGAVYQSEWRRVPEWVWFFIPAARRGTQLNVGG